MTARFAQADAARARAKRRAARLRELRSAWVLESQMTAEELVEASARRKRETAEREARRAA